MDYRENRNESRKNEDIRGPYWQSGKMSYHCPRCNAGYTYKKTLKTHMKYDCGKEPRFKCPYCNKRDKYNRDNQKLANLELIYGSLPYERSAVGSDLGYKYHYDQRKSFECLKCGTFFTQKTTITRHVRYFCGRGYRYQCPYCDTKASCSSNIYRHVRSRHKGLEAHAVKLFTSFEPHRTTHQYGNTIDGEQSQRIWRDSPEGKRRKIYSDNKSHYCPRCNRGFTLKKNMNRHLRHECGMAPKYQCPYCDKPSKFTQNIYAHIRKYHPGQSLSFFQASSSSSYFHGVPLLPGRRVRRCLIPNTALRGTYECPNCRKIYKWYRGLHRHLTYECGKAPRFKCPHCVYAGKHRSHVYSHIKSNHHNRPVYALDTQED
uniref:zinc finger protein 845-like n=1 Tax=Vespula vulgaris TaxID=7454 RepID=UPI00223B982D|nr:zinc finger protein 845-like [Vespula vulgaris]